ncbi:MAG: 6-bladed beta-propeller [Longimicrobiales bacterium]
MRTTSEECRSRPGDVRSGSSIVRLRGVHSLLLLASALTGACGLTDRRYTADVVRDTLPNGVVRLRYVSFPPPASEPVAVELRIGAVEGEPYEIFGDVRGIEVDADGNIYILDYQASEVRAFDASGAFLRTLTRKGAGPGELTEANGMVLRDSTLWIQDHGKWQMIGIDLEGEEVARHKMHVLSYGYIWNGAVDDRGRFWKETSHSDEERTYPPPEGLNEGSSRSFLKWFDPATNATDSIFLGESTYQSYISRNSRGGYTYRGIPFSARSLLLIDPAGGFWRSSGEAYRIARLDESGDTTLVIEADVPPLPVTDEQRNAFIEDVVEREPDQRRAAEELAALAPESRQVLDQLILDDEGRLWARRVAAEGEKPLFDIFTRDGEYLGSVRLRFQPASYFPPRIRYGSFYTLVRDSLDVPTVVRATVPPLGHRDLIGMVRALHRRIRAT